MGEAFECPEPRPDWSPAYQWNLSRRNCYEAENDAVGIGVVTSFVICASIILIVVVGAYIAAAIPAALWGEVDDEMHQRINNALPRYLQPARKKQEQRIQALSHFLLSLGDQQTVTALALLIAAYYHHYDITVYDINVAGSLTLLAMSVYNVALPIITEGTRSLQTCHGRLRAIPNTFRFLVAGFNFIGMACIFVLQEGDNWWPDEDKSDLWFLPGVHHFSLSDVMTPLINYTILLNFTFDYVDAGICLFTKRVGILDWTIWKLKNRCQLSRMPEPGDYIALKARNACALPRLLKHFHESSLEESYVFCKYSESALATYLGQIIFAFIYGTVTVWMSRNGPEQHIGTGNDADRWGFGQVVPMVLLLLPFLAIFEAWHSYKAQTSSMAAHDQTEQVMVWAEAEELPMASFGDRSSTLVNQTTQFQRPWVGAPSAAVVAEHLQQSYLQTHEITSLGSPARPEVGSSHNTHDTRGTRSKTILASSEEGPSVSQIRQQRSSGLGQLDGIASSSPQPSTPSPAPASASNPKARTVRDRKRFAKRSMMRKLWFLIFCDMAAKFVFAASASLWLLKIDAIDRITELTYGYVIATAFRATYSAFAALYCLRKDEKGLETHRHFWLIGYCGKIACCSIGLIFSSCNNSFAGWGSMMAVFLWIYIALLPSDEANTRSRKQASARRLTDH